MYQKRTLRRMKPTARKVAELANEAELLARRLQRMVEEVTALEFDSEELEALQHFKSDEFTMGGLKIGKNGKVTTTGG